MSRLKLDRGVDRDFDLAVLDPDKIPYDPDANPSPFVDDDVLAVTVWRGDEAPPLITPAVAWTDSTGTAAYRISFTETDTEALEPDIYSIRVTVTRGSVTAPVHDGDLEIAPSPGETISPIAPPTFTPATPRPQLDTVYCTDEDIALDLQRDFKALCPPWMLLATGKDGAFTTTSPWVLSSASVDFEVAGVVSGNVLYLDRPGVTGGTDLLAVESVAGHSLLLRRLNRAPGIGFPPGPPEGANRVNFGVRSFDDMIEDASFELNAIFGVGPNLPCQSPVILERIRELRRLCILSVRIRAYTANWQFKSDDWAMKLELAQKEWETKRSSMVLHITSTTGGCETRSLGMRIART